MDEQRRRQQRREFIRTHHPDRGGDPAVFVAGLGRFDTDEVPEPTARIFIVTPVPWPRRMITVVTRRRRHREQPPRVR